MSRVHTIPVPHGWTVAEAWDAIAAGRLLPTRGGRMWANVLVVDGRLVEVL